MLSPLWCSPDGWSLRLAQRFDNVKQLKGVGITPLKQSLVYKVFFNLRYSASIYYLYVFIGTTHGNKIFLNGKTPVNI